MDASPFGQEELSIAITKKVKELNKNERIEIVLLRDIEAKLGESDRVDKVNEIDADLLITINVRDYIEDIERVLDIYISKENSKYEESKILAKAFRDSIPSELRNGGINEFGTIITMDSNCPAVLLEFSLTKKYEDRAFIESEKGHAQIAEMILSNL